MNLWGFMGNYMRQLVTRALPKVWYLGGSQERSRDWRGCAPGVDKWTWWGGKAACGGGGRGGEKGIRVSRQREQQSKGMGKSAVLGVKNIPFMESLSWNFLDLREGSGFRSLPWLSSLCTAPAEIQVQLQCEEPGLDCMQSHHRPALCISCRATWLPSILTHYHGDTDIILFDACILFIADHQLC